MDFTAQEYPSTPPHLACRYSALEIASFVLVSDPARSEEDRAAFDVAVNEAGMPPELVERLAQRSATGFCPLTPNPYLSGEQLAALVMLLTWIGGDVAQPVVEAIGEQFGMDQATLAYLAQRARWLPEASGSRTQALLHPPEGVAELARDSVQRLRLRSHLVRPVGHISPHFYEHPLDRAALEKLRSITGFDLLARKASEWVSERTYHMLATSSMIRISNQQFPGLHSLWSEALYRAGMDAGNVDLYISNDGINAYTRGVTHKQVVLGSGLVSRLGAVELMFVIGHELGHIRSEHVLYRMVAENFSELVKGVGTATLGIGSLLAGPLRWALMDWYRKSEFTCDRFGLLVCQDLDAGARTLMKLAGSPAIMDRLMNWKAFAEQGSALDIESTANKAFLAWATLEQTHPWPAVRAHQLWQWAESAQCQQLRSFDVDAYQRAMQQVATGNAVLPRFSTGSQPSLQTGRCAQCHNPLDEGQRFCDRCGAST